MHRVLAYPLLEMRPLIRINGEEVGMDNLMGKNSLVASAQEAWNAWEIHFLILASLFLQVFLFLFAGMRRRSASGVLRTVLWLAYLSADSVAIFVLGHLAVHASEPGHQLMSLWAPFVLVHLGGQDTITAFSRQDNELWRRHLLSLVTQVAVAGYVVAAAPSWSDGRLRAAMVLMFLSGCFKYAERVGCLYFAAPARLRSGALGDLSLKVGLLHRALREPKTDPSRRRLAGRFDMTNDDFDTMVKGTIPLNLVYEFSAEVVSVDAPLNDGGTVLNADHLPGILTNQFLSNADHCRRAYEFVGEALVHCYDRLYTKTPLRRIFWFICSIVPEFIRPCNMKRECKVLPICFITLIMLYPLFQIVSAPIALVLFWAAEKGGHLHANSSSADITVSYILLVGASVLDMFSVLIFVYANTSHRRGWSEEIAQYSMIKRHAVQDTSGMAASIRQWLGRHLGAWGAGLLELTRVPITRDHKSPIKDFILHSLLQSGTRKEWNLASSRGALALQKWMLERQQQHQSGSDSAWTGKEVLENSISADFPTSVLIWHIATEICYYTRDSGSSNSDQTKKHKQMSREISNYVMYLVFKCGVMLTINSQHVHDTVHDEIKMLFEVALGEKATVMKLFGATAIEEEEEKQAGTTVVETQKHEKLLAHEQQEGSSTVNQIQKHEELPEGGNASSAHIQKLMLSTVEALDTPVLPRAREVAQALISINDQAECWDLIAKVWSEMLFYTAPRCGAAFHYEHLSTGGEFITHVLLLMKSLGPFLPPPGA